MASIKLRKHESFYIREGWFEKAINTIHESNTNIFYKNDGIRYLGIGANMVKSLKYWLKAAGIIDGKENELTQFAQLLLKYDQYLDEPFSWYLIHYNLIANQEECPVFYEIVNSDMNTFSKTDLDEYLFEKFALTDPKINRNSIDSDVTVFLKSYFNDEPATNPEENYVCPLSRLRLIKKDKNGYMKTRPAYTSLSYLIVYYVLSQIYNYDPFDIEDSMHVINSPYRIFNLDKFMYLQFLDEASRNGLINIDRTAGLNTVYFEKKLTLEEVFAEVFGGDLNV